MPWVLRKSSSHCVLFPYDQELQKTEVLLLSNFEKSQIMNMEHRIQNTARDPSYKGDESRQDKAGHWN